VEKLIKFLNDLEPEDQTSFALKCGTSIGYLRKACSKGQKLGDAICINIERESDRRVTCEDLRPDVDWAYLRGTSKHREQHQEQRAASGG
jgi:DNA-binding transcriptional regulator YdaS (Cro superfamily)